MRIFFLFFQKGKKKKKRAKHFKLKLFCPKYVAKQRKVQIQDQSADSVQSDLDLQCPQT